MRIRRLQFMRTGKRMPTPAAAAGAAATAATRAAAASAAAAHAAVSTAAAAATAVRRAFTAAGAAAAEPPPVTSSGIFATVSDSYGDDGPQGTTRIPVAGAAHGCHALGAACDQQRCCVTPGASCFRTYANEGVDSYNCQRSCFERGSGRACPVLAACAKPWRDCSASGCCVSDAQRCYEKNRTFASCMPECNPALPRFRGWSCVDRDGRSNDQQAAAAAANSFGAIDGASGRSDRAESVARSAMRNILGDDLTLLGESTLGLDSKHLFLLFLTLTGLLACGGLLLAWRLGRAACQGSSAKALARRRARALSARPQRVAKEEEEADELDEEEMTARM